MSVENFQSTRTYEPEMDFSPSGETDGAPETAAYDSFHAEAYGTPATNTDTSVALADATVTAQGVVPEVEPNTEHEGGVLGVVAPIVGGAWNELTQHPDRVLLNAAMGVGMSLAIPAAYAAAPLITVGGLVALGGYGLWKLAEAIPGWAHDVSVAFDPDSHTEAERDKADAGLNAFGAGTLDAAAGFAGVWAAPKIAANEAVISLTNSFKQAVAPAVESVANVARPWLGQAETFVTAAADRVKTVAAPLLADTGNAVMSVARGSADLAKQATSIAAPLAENTGKAVLTIAQNTKTALAPMVNSVVETTAPILQKVAEKANPIMQGAAERMQPLVDRVVKAGTPVVETVSEVAGRYADKALTALDPAIKQGEGWILTLRNETPKVFTQVAAEAKPIFEAGRKVAQDVTTNVGGAANVLTSNADMAMKTARAELGQTWYNLKNVGKMGPLEAPPTMSADIIKFQDVLRAKVQPGAVRNSLYYIDPMYELQRA